MYMILLKKVYTYILQYFIKISIRETVSVGAVIDRKIGFRSEENQR